MQNKKILVVIVMVVMIFSGLGAFINGPVSHPTSGSSHNNKIIPEISSAAKKSRSTPSSVSNSVRTAASQNVKNVLSEIKNGTVSQKDVYVPNLNSNIGLQSGHVQPSYSSSPAPMGIGDFGLNNQSGTIVPYNLSTSTFIGSISINSSNVFYPGDQNASSYSIQLNTVLNNVTLDGNSSYVFWTQNVAFYSTRTDTLQLIDNIWNFTGYEIGQNAIYSGNGTNEFLYYYDLGPSFNVSGKFTLNLYLTTSVINGETAVKFSYSVAGGSVSSKGTYDTVLFNSTYGTPTGYSAPDAHFLVSGSQLTPLGTLNDAELILGGPGGGSTATFYNLSGSMKLQYFSSSGQYINAPSAYDYGTDTGETSDGVAIAWQNSQAILSSGPSLLYGMWNDSTITQMQSYSGSVTPTNSFFFVSPGSTFNASTASWVPLQVSGKFRFTLPSGSYTGNVSLSDYNPQIFPISSLNSITLNENLYTGIYTPLYALSNSQLQNISSTGSGTSSSPYLLFNSSIHNLNRVYGISNDYGFPLFFGLLLYNTSAHTDINGFSLLVATVANHFEINGFNYYYYTNTTLSDIFDNTQYISLWGSQIHPQSFSSVSTSILLLNSRDDLIGNNVFLGGFTQVKVVDGSGNYIWGNHFIGNISSSVFQGISLSGSGNNTIYNNYFYGMFFPASSYNTPLLNSNEWYIQKESVSNVAVFNGYSLTGSIIGTSYQGGNYWWNYNGISPFYDFYQISSGDFVPLAAPNYLTFHETGLPDSCYFSAILNNTNVASFNSSSYITLNLLNGHYNYSIPDVNLSYDYTDPFLPNVSYVPSISQGNLSLTGGSTEINVHYSPKYLVQFNESGLPYGTTWYVNLSNGQSFNSTYYGYDPYLYFYEPNGTYSWIASSSISNSSSGTFRISGNAAFQSVFFGNIHVPVTFVEIGLPSGSQWYVLIDGQQYSSSSHDMNVKLPVGNYTFSIPSVSGYMPFPSSGSFSTQNTASVSIGFESPASQKYGYVSSTIDPITGTFHSGGYINLTRNLYDGSVFSAYDPTDGYLFASLANGNVSVINAATNTVVRLISLGHNVEGLDVVYSTYTGYIYVTAVAYNSQSRLSYLFVIQPTTMSVIKTVTFQSDFSPVYLAADAMNGAIYVSNFIGGNVSVVNGTTGAIMKTIQIANVNYTGGIAYDAQNNLIYVAYQGNVSILNPSTNSVETTLSTGINTHPIFPVIDTYSNILYVIRERGNLTLYNISTGSLIKTVDIGKGEYLSGVVDPLNNMLYVSQFIATTSSNYYLTNVSVVDSSGQIVSQIPEYFSVGITFDQSTHNLYLSSILGGIFSIATPESNPVLKISVSTTDSTVTVNGVSVTLKNGKFQGSFSPGYYYVNVSAKGYSSYSDYLYLSYGNTYTVNVTLKQLVTYGYLNGTIFPNDANVIANGIAISVLNGHFNASLSPGTYFVSFTANGYNSIVKEVNITAGKTSTLDVSMTSVTNSVTLTGYLNPENASLVVDGFVAYVNSTGYYHISLSAGTYTISVYESGYYPYSENITLPSSRVMNFTLAKEPSATSITSLNSTTATGYNVTVSNLKIGNGVISVSFNSGANGTLLVQIPYVDMKNATISEILNSTVYINGVPYSNYTVSISSSYTIILKVYGLKSGDPTLSWKYSPSGIVSAPPSPSSVSPPPSLFVYEVMGAIISVGIVAGAVVITLGKRRR